MSKKDAFGKRMKAYELVGTGQKLLTDIPVVARIDGRAFHSFCKKHFKSPYDEDFNRAMIATTEYLVKETNALIGYTQSDEITLIYNNEYNRPMLFNGKVHKLNSVLAAMATAAFIGMMHESTVDAFKRKIAYLIAFDCRVYNVPDKEEACNVLLWREKDATRNSIFSLARTYYSHSELYKKGSNEIQNMLLQKNINWNDCPAHQKRGTYIRKVATRLPWLASGVDPQPIIKDLPEKHEAKFNPNLVIERKMLRYIHMPPFSKVVNKIEVVFDGAQPELCTKDTLDEIIDSLDTTTPCGENCGCK